ncbi:MAG TPA: ABC transporter ATP-binding protein [Sediminispirochaeta sp.]|nr:ABC transporter ATP-binding protein [Sediminispirochaeta sp.]
MSTKSALKKEQRSLSGEKLPVRFQHVSFSYGEEEILKDISFAIKQGDLAAIIGPNGGGKTTILKLILGLIEADRGEVELFGSAPKISRARVGYVPQYSLFDPLFPASVRDVVMMGRLGLNGGSLFKRLGPYRKSDLEKCSRALAEVGLDGLEGRLFTALSGGQRQRVLIARALAGDAELLLMDEPTSNVDRRAEKEIYQLLGSLKKERSIILVSHDTAVVSSISDMVLCVNRTLMQHDSCELTGDMLQKLYGSEMHLVLHDPHAGVHDD